MAAHLAQAMAQHLAHVDDRLAGFGAGEAVAAAELGPGHHDRGQRQGPRVQVP